MTLKWMQKQHKRPHAITNMSTLPKDLILEHATKSPIKAKDYKEKIY